MMDHRVGGKSLSSQLTFAQTAKIVIVWVVIASLFLIEASQTSSVPS